MPEPAAPAQRSVAHPHAAANARADGLSLSIVVPVLNEAAQVGAALEALRARCGEARNAFPGGIDVVLADGGSTDGTPAAVRAAAWEGVQLVEAPRGRARQMNAGAAASTGQVLLFLHVDTHLPPAGLVRMAERLTAEPRRAWGRFDVRIAGRSRWFPVIAAMMNLRSALTGIATGDQAMFVRRDAFEAVGRFPDQALMEDIELSRRLSVAAHGHPIRMRERVLTSGRRWETRGVWPTILLMWRLRWRYWRGASPEDLARAYR